MVDEKSLEQQLEEAFTEVELSKIQNPKFLEIDNLDPRVISTEEAERIVEDNYPKKRITRDNRSLTGGVGQTFGPFGIRIDYLTYIAGTMIATYFFYRYNQKNPLEYNEGMLKNMGNDLIMASRTGVMGYFTNLINVGISKLRKIRSIREFFKVTFGIPLYAIPSGLAMGGIGIASFSHVSLIPYFGSIVSYILASSFALLSCNLTRNIYNNGFSNVMRQSKDN